MRPEPRQEKAASLIVPTECSEISDGPFLRGVLAAASASGGIVTAMLGVSCLLNSSRSLFLPGSFNPEGLEVTSHQGIVVV